MTGDNWPYIEETIYANKINRRLISVVGSILPRHRIRCIKGDGLLDETLFADVVENAAEQDIISAEERHEIYDLQNNVLQCENRQDRSVTYAAVTITATVEDSDIRRTADRAGILRRASGKTAIPAVIGARIDDVRRQLAQERGVTLIHVGFEEVKMIDVAQIKMKESQP